MTNDDFIKYVEAELAPRPGRIMTLIAKAAGNPPLTYQDKRGYRWKYKNGWQMIKEAPAISTTFGRRY